VILVPSNIEECPLPSTYARVAMPISILRVIVLLGELSAVAYIAIVQPQLACTYLVHVISNMTKSGAAKLGFE